MCRGKSFNALDSLKIENTRQCGKMHPAERAEDMPMMIFIFAPDVGRGFPMWQILENNTLRRCTACGHIVCTAGHDKAQVFPAEWNFCPHCGKKMQEEEEDEKDDIQCV